MIIANWKNNKKRLSVPHPVNTTNHSWMEECLCHSLDYVVIWAKHGGGSFASSGIIPLKVWCYRDILASLVKLLPAEPDYGLAGYLF